MPRATVNTGVKVHQRAGAKVHQLEERWSGRLASWQGVREGDCPLAAAGRVIFVKRVRWVRLVVDRQ
jgi:hypothetical protein